jgi:hypothetical protein
MKLRNSFLDSRNHKNATIKNAVKCVFDIYSQRLQDKLN